MKSMAIPMLLLAGVLAGCQSPPKLVSYPPNSLPVEFELATGYSTCLLASVVMVANYTEDRPRFKVNGVLADLKAAGDDETKPNDLKKYMARKGLDLWTLAGRMDDNPSTGLGFWLRQQRYPVVCIINRLGDNPDFNHAVVVIGVGEDQNLKSADRIHYLDPSADSPLYTCTATAFETMWARCRYAMLVATKPATGSTVGQDGG